MKTLLFISLLANAWCGYKICKRHKLDVQFINLLTKLRNRLRQHLRIKVIKLLIEPIKPQTFQSSKQSQPNSDTQPMSTPKEVIDVLDMIIRDRGYTSGGGVLIDDLITFLKCVDGVSIDSQQRKRVVNTAIALNGTLLYEDIIHRIPQAQEKIIEALDSFDIEVGRKDGRAKEYLKFIR